MNFLKFLFIFTLLASLNEAFDPSSVAKLLPNVTVSQTYQMSRLLINTQIVVSKIEQIINLNNFYPLYSNYGLDDFLNCTAKQLTNLQTINLCISSYSQFANLINQTVLQNTFYYFSKSIGPAFAELWQSQTLRNWLLQKNIEEGIKCFFTQALNPTSVTCMGNFTQLVGFVNTISNQNIVGFLTYFKLFFNDNFNKWSVTKTIAKSTVNTDVLGKITETFDCIIQTTNECLQNTGLSTFVSDGKVRKLNELLETSETILVSTGLPAGSFDLIKAKLTEFDKVATDILAKNESKIFRSNLLVLFFSALIFFIKIY